MSIITTPSPRPRPRPRPLFFFISTFWQCKIDFVHHVPISVQNRSKTNFKTPLSVTWVLVMVKVYSGKNKESEFKFCLYQNDAINSN